jgi:nucleoside-diphosphate-sugar epimerase
MANKGKQIALTGASGFAGGPILAELLRNGHQVRVLARRPQQGQFDANVAIVKGDLDDLTALNALVSGVDVVVHVAGAISALDDNGFFKINFGGTRNLFNAAESAGVKRFINVSSMAARNPELSAYAASKRAAEDFLDAQKTKMEILTLRPSAIYGPGDKATLPLLSALQKTVAAIPGQSKSRFSLVHVEDFASVVAEAAMATQTGVIEVDDMSGGHDWHELATLNRKINGNPRHVVFLPRSLVTGVAIASEIGAKFTGQTGMVNRGKVNELYHGDWVARGSGWPRDNPIRLAEGLTETVTWYRAHGWLPPMKQAVTTAL